MIRRSTLRRTLTQTLLTFAVTAPPTTALALMGRGGTPVGINVGDLDPALDVTDDCLEFGTLYVCGDWQENDDGAWTLEGGARVPTLAGDIHLSEATLTASLDPPALDGEARLEFPALGFLSAAGFDGNAPWGRVALGDGDVLDSIDINGVEMPTEPGHQYLIVDYDAGLGIEFGAFSMSDGGGAATVVIDVNDPLIYVGGDVDGFLGQGQITDAAVGFSLGGALPFETALPLCKKNGKQCRTKRLTGNVITAGRAQIGRYPVWVDSDLIIDIDANSDGDTIFDGDVTDLRFGMNGAIDVGFSMGPVDLTIPVAEGSVIYDGSIGDDGRLQLRGMAGVEGIFDGTPLEMLQPDTPEVDLKGWFSAIDDFSLHMDYSGPLFGLETDNVKLALSDAGIAASGTLRPAYVDLFGDAAVQFEGNIGVDGAFLFQGSAHISIAGFEMADALCTWSNAGLRIAGTLDLPGLGSVAVTGAVDHNGHVTFDGEVDIELLGFQIANASIELDGGALAVSGELGLPALGSIAVSGDIHSDGDFRFTGRGALEPIGFELASVRVTFEPGGVEVRGDVDLAGLASGSISGAVWTAETSTLPGGDHFQCQLISQMVAPQLGFVPPCPPPAPGFRLRGDMNVGWQGINIAGATVYVTNSGARIRGDFDFAGVEFRVAGDVTASGRVDLTSTASVNWSGGIPGASAKLSGEVELEMGVKSSGPYLGASFDVKACAKIWPVETCVNAGGSVHSNGNVCIDFPLVGNQCLDLGGIL